MASNLTGASFNSGGCAPDTTGPDAFFQFTLTATTPIQIQAQGTAYNHTLALFNSGMTAIACNDGTVATGGTITNGALAAGTYYVGLKTRSSGVGGAFQVAFRDTSAGAPYATQMGCSTTNTLDATLLANTDYYVIVKGAAAGQAGAYTLSVTDIGAVADIGCSNDLSAPDAYFEFDVSDPAGRTVTIAMNEDASHLDGSFQLVRDGAPYNNATGDVPYACETNSHTYTGLPQGKYYVVVRGTAVANGAGDKPVEITFRDDGGANALDCANGSSSSAGTITRTLQPGTYYAGITSRNGATGGAYKLQVRDTSVATGGGGGTWVACGDSSYKITYDIPNTDAGQVYSVVVKGAAAGAEGAYTLSVTDVSSVGDSCAVGDSIQMDPSAPDVFYEFTVADTDSDGRDVNVALASSSALDGAYRLFKSDGTPVGPCPDRTAPFTYPDLPAGTYYIALRGKNAASGGAEAAYEVSIRDQDSFGALECKDGAANLGTTITRTLQPGDYWVGIRNTPGQPNPLNYQLQFPRHRKRPAGWRARSRQWLQYQRDHRVGHAECSVLRGRQGQRARRRRSVRLDGH